MEKLSGNATSDPSSPSGVVSGGSTTGQSSATSPSVGPSITANLPTPSPQNPFLQKSTNPSSAGIPKPAIRVRPAEGAIKRSRDGSDPQTSTPPRKHTTEAKEESIEEFETRSLTNIFRFTLDPDRPKDFSGNKLTYLPSLKQELEESGDAVRLSVGCLDSALMEAISQIPGNKAPLEYLLPCWKRVLRATKSLRGYASEKDILLKEAKRLCMSSCIFSVTMPELYGRESNPLTDSLIPYLLKDPEDDCGIDFAWLTEAVGRFDEDETVLPMLTKTMAGLSSQLSTMDMNGDYKPYVNVLKLFSKFKPLVVGIAADPLFHMATSAPNIEMMTTLGPFFRISALQPGVTKVYFAGPKTMDRGHIKTSQNALRLTLNQHQKDLKEVIDAFVRAGDVPKNRVLDWFAHIVNENHKRRAMRVDERTVSSDGFMMNITVILDYLCEPFMDATFSKVDKIDVGYLRRKPRVDIKEETKMNADQQASDDFYSTHLEGSNNFISEVFFLTLAAHHYGSEATNSKMKSLEKDIKYFNDKIAELERERPKFLNVSYLKIAATELQ